VPLEALKTLLRVLTRLRPLAGEDMAKKVVPHLPEVVFHRQLLDLENKDLRNITKKDIEDVDLAMRSVLKTGLPSHSIHREQSDELCDKFCYAFALKCLRSPLQDKKFNGLAHIEESIDAITKVSLKTNTARPPPLTCPPFWRFRTARTSIGPPCS
jgi:hypothetical protein